MKKIKGIAASPGIYIGKVFLYLDEIPNIPQYTILKGQLEQEIKRYSSAVEQATHELEILKDGLDEGRDSQIGLLDSHLLMINDPDLSEKVKKCIRTELCNAEWALHKQAQNLVEQFSAIDDLYIRERALDIHDVAKRIMNKLLYRERIDLEKLNRDIVLVSHNLLPSDAIAMDKEHIKAILTDIGGKTSHTAIIARSFEIPAVLGLSDISKQIKNGDEVIVDGSHGDVIVNPDEASRKHYLEAAKIWQEREVSLLTLNDLPAETKDGKLIHLAANIEIPEETDAVLAHGADGIGLYRSEFLFLKPGVFSSESEQLAAYKQVLDNMEGKPVVIRTLDLGGDKAMWNLQHIEEKNPILGWRAIRFCMSEKDVFRVQLRALLRAGIYGDLRIMFPMISGLSELNRAMEFLEEVKAELKSEGIPYFHDVPVGIMIEIPSAAMTSDILAKKVDFFSIGTNDLIQYSIAVDRGNEKIAYLYDPFHIGVLRLIKLTIDNAHAASIPVSMCGEMAGEPLATLVLLGLGLDVFSMSSFSIPEIKQIIRAVSLSEAEELAGDVMAMRSSREIEKYIKGWMDERFDFPAY